MTEIEADDPKFHLLFIPGNPGFFYMTLHMHTRYDRTNILLCSFIIALRINLSGVVPFYKDFLESLYEFLDGNASITGLFVFCDSNEFDLVLFPSNS